MKRWMTWMLAAAACLGLGLAQPAQAAKKVSVAYITNGVADFWTIAKAGAEAGAKEAGVEVTVIMPSGMADQKRRIEDLIVRGVNGIALSPIDPANQIDAINKAAAATHVITMDSDAPGTNRLMYIGMDNYKAGRMAGELMRKALPSGGKVMIFIGRVEQDNAKRRRQGTIDAILGRSEDATRYDEPGKVLTSDDGKYIILGTLTDQFDRAKAKANVEDTLARNPDIAGMVGLFEYNPPLILEALDAKHKLGKVKVVGFDENPLVLQGIKDGIVEGTIVQNPYEYGRQSVLTLAKLAADDKSVIPASKFVDIPAQVIEKSNVDAFWADLKKKTGKK